MFSPKDFIETVDGLLFAVVDQRLEQDKALCFLRYVHQGGVWRKKMTDEANAFLLRHHPEYLHYSNILDASLHAVAKQRIVRHHQPRHRLHHIMLAERHDPIEGDLFELGVLLRQQGLDLTKVGVTGSLLVGVQRDRSDIDLVCYDREVFQECRAIVCQLIEAGLLQSLRDDDWQESFRRRNCSLGFEEYVRHERRKFNKALVNGRKFDLNLIEQRETEKENFYQKIGTMTLRCRISDDRQAFDHPAVYRIEHDTIGRIVCFTATYTGQAFTGETVEVSGILEKNEQGFQQIVVGSTREAHGEYIRVIDA